MPHFTEIISIIALGFCVLAAMSALLVPKWMVGIVRLVADPDPERPGGFAEFRAVYGGFFLMLHITALVIVLVPTAQLPIQFKIFALFPISVAWIGAGFGRAISLFMDGDENRGSGNNFALIAVEMVLGIAIAAPVLQLTL